MPILLVDDERELTDSLAQLFAREGYQVDVAYDGQKALDLLRQEDPSLVTVPYHLLILDWMLPWVSGLEICRYLRSAGNLTPVLFLTAKDTLDDRVQGLDVGGDDYLIKPFELRELLARVRALLRRSSGSPTPPSPTTKLQVADLELDCDNRLAYRQGRVIDLSEKEFQLLQFFMRHPGQLLSHDQIHQHLWPLEEKPSSNVLAAQVRLLRRKIEGEGSPLIRAVYGKGYRFAAGETP
ncbi:MAG: two-component system response regulator RppA [Cyanobacteriota bacterium]|nr:two-component system response regulator RppA [Cyanobacteriota bacterium]